MLKIVPRDKKYMQGFKEYCQEFYDHNILWFQPANPAKIDENWFERTADWYSKKEQGLVPGYPKSFHFWAVDGENFIGEFQLRPDLTDEIMTGMGSIGYSVRITEQGKGYGKEILRQGLDIARNHNLKKVLLTINDKNTISIHICESLGGVLMDKIITNTTSEGEQLIRRYWIDL